MVKAWVKIKRHFVNLAVLPIKENAINTDWMLRRLPEVQVIRKGDEVTVIVPKNIHHALVGLLVDEALRRAGLHPDQHGL